VVEIGDPPPPVEQRRNVRQRLVRGGDLNVVERGG
jgi:hypothetical protein